MTTVDEILAFAIEREQEAHDFYTSLAEKTERPGMREVFTRFAGEELAHRQRLEAIQASKELAPASAKVMDLQIAEYLVDVDAHDELDYQRALILAMKREKASYRLYCALAESCESPELERTFAMLAQEEAKHKLRFEVEYDEVILAEN